LGRALPRFPRFPYTTLFRSGEDMVGLAFHAALLDVGHGRIEAAVVVLGIGEDDDALAARAGGARSLVRKRARGREHARHAAAQRSEEHTSELQSRENLVCRL